MAAEQKQKKDSSKDNPKSTEAKNLSAKGEELKADMDDLVDAIDDVLEENAEQFVKDYVQRGGE